MNDQFRPPMFQSGLFAPKRSALDVIFTATCDFTAMPFARSHIYSYFWRFFLGGKCHGPRHMESKTELIPEPKVRSRNQSFLFNRNCSRNRFRMAMLCWKRNRNQPQLFLAESESISVSWDQAQVFPTQYEKCETSIIFLNIAPI